MYLEESGGTTIVTNSKYILTENIVITVQGTAVNLQTKS